MLKSYLIIADFLERVNQAQVSKLAFSNLPGWNGNTQASAGLDLTTNILQELLDYAVAVGHRAGQNVWRWRASERLTKVGFAGDDVDLRLPLPAGSIADF